MSGLISLADILLPTKRKIFVSYHHDNDQIYKNILVRAFAQQFEIITDNSLSRALDSDDPDYVSRRIRENHISGSSCTIVLCGSETRWRKYVDWEIKATLDKEHGIIGVHLPTNLPDSLGGVHKPDRLQDNIDSGYAVWIDWGSFVSSLEALNHYIEIAINKSSRLINNSRTMRRRNGT